MKNIDKIMKGARIYSAFAAAVFVVAACGCKKINSESEYEAWLSDEENGHAVTKYAGALKFTVKFIPAEYLIYKEKKKMKYQPTENELKDLEERFGSGMKFILTIAPSEHVNGGDIMYYNITNEAEFEKRVKLLNFEMDKYVKIKAGGKEFKPVLHLLENTHSTTSYRHLHFVFADEEGNELAAAEELDFIFNDEVFGTGISHFIFKKARFEKAPEINF